MYSNANPATANGQHSQTLPRSKAAHTHEDGIFQYEALSNDDLSDAATIFEAFKDISLDLTFSFSTENSPATSTSELPPPEPPSPLPPSSSTSLAAPVGAVPSAHALSRTMSFTSQMSPLSPLLKTKKKFKSTKFSPEQSTSILRGSWPAIKYVGRGTPVDKSRRKEWSGISVEDVGEDGLLFSPIVEAKSLDSRSPRLSSSSDWDFLNTGLPPSGSSSSPKGSVSVHGPLTEEEERTKEKEKERVPPLQMIEVQLPRETPEDWASATQTVLCSTEKDDKEDATSPCAPHPAQEFKTTAVTQEDRGGHKVLPETQLPQVELPKLEPELQFDLNIDEALDLGFSPVVDGGTFFTLAPVTGSDHSNPTMRPTSTVSSHSQYSTPSEGPSDDRPTPSGAESNVRMQDQPTPVARIFSDIKSITSTKADTCAANNTPSNTEEGMPWWKKVLGRLKRVHVSLRPHRSLC